MKRDFALDGLRGLFLVVMTVDHLGLSLSNYTIHRFGFVTAAEGFVFLSGFVAGIAYGNIGAEKGESALRRAALRRMLIVYLFHVSAFVLVLTSGLFIPSLVSSWKATIPYFTDPLIINMPLTAFLLGAALLYQPAYLDILPMYCIFLFVTPFLIERFMHGRAKSILALSVAVWFAAQLGALEILQSSLQRFAPVHLGSFNILGWQLLYIAGLYCGFVKRSGTQWSSLYDKRLLAACFFAALFFCMLRNGFFGVNPFETFWLFVRKDELGIMRLLNVAALAYLFAVARAYFDKIPTWRWFGSLGRHSLQVYAYHVILIFALAPLIPQVRMLSEPLGIAFTTASVLSLSLPAWIHYKYRRIAYGERRAERQISQSSQIQHN